VIGAYCRDWEVSVGRADSESRVSWEELGRFDPPAQVAVELDSAAARARTGLALRDRPRWPFPTAHRERCPLSDGDGGHRQGSTNPSNLCAEIRQPGSCAGPSFSRDGEIRTRNPCSQNGLPPVRLGASRCGNERFRALPGYLKAQLVRLSAPRATSRSQNGRTNRACERDSPE